MKRYIWKDLNHIQLGKYAEYFTKMEFTMMGFDVYSTEVDDRGIDFVIRRDEKKYYDVQVKSVRNFNYIFFLKEKFHLRNNLLAAVVLFIENEPPKLYLIPSTVWLTPDSLFVSRDYKEKKSKPEWGINLSKHNLPKLFKYSFEDIVLTL